ncbi:CPBP family intramembrane glutamic endopeptidase [Rhodococcus sp. Q]|uniref:CPBP family intramembrane glutamic endopeptidase n=1 Tax=Rhodococcus sp. Q TaxID=2502252 RepID=UPI0010F8482D|nr:CPBP family intramembrane glutamic endopeptidase [Rhodococcus sp. Q]
MRRTAGAAAVGCAAALVAWNGVVLPRLALGARGRASANTVTAVVVGGAAVVGGVSFAELGWTAWRRGLLVGVAASTLPTLAYPAMLAVPPVRARMASGARRADHTEWVFVHIPLGTVLAEEVVFRSVLYALARRASPRWAPVLGAAAFGLWHVTPARHAGDSVVGTVALTAAASLLFDQLRERSGSVLAPALLHLAVNAGGAVAAETAAGRTVTGRSVSDG